MLREHMQHRLPIRGNKASKHYLYGYMQNAILTWKSYVFAVAEDAYTVMRASPSLKNYEKRFIR